MREGGSAPGVLRGVVDRRAVDVLQDVERALVVEGQPVDLLEARGVDLRPPRGRRAVEGHAAVAVGHAQDARVARRVGQSAQLGDVERPVRALGDGRGHRLVLPVEEAHVAGRGVLRRQGREVVGQREARGLREGGAGRGGRVGRRLVGGRVRRLFHRDRLLMCRPAGGLGTIRALGRALARRGRSVRTTVLSVLGPVPRDRRFIAPTGSVGSPGAVSRS